MAIESVEEPCFGAGDGGRRVEEAWILVLWIVVPLVAYLVAGLWTYLSYYVILYPVYFLVLGALARRAVPLKILVAGIAAFVLGNIVYHAGCEPVFGPVRRSPGDIRVGTRLQTGSGQVRGSARRCPGVVKENRLLQMDQLAAGEPAQLDLPFLAMQHGHGETRWPTNQLMLVVDDNRTGFDASRVNFGATGTNFGPMRIYVINRP
jgi:hypothetical protein